jgi:hypothetical protein
MSPESGNYRQFDARQAFWLGMVLKLKQFGIVAPLAAKIAGYAEQSCRTASQHLSWDFGFDPTQGKFDTNHWYVVELGGVEDAGLEYIRFGTGAGPSPGDRIVYFAWHRRDTPGRPIQGLRPCVILRLDLSLIAQLLAPAFN